MQKALLVKAVLVAVVFALLLIPLSMIGGIVSERAVRQLVVAQEIAASSFGRQTFAGPLLSLPYTEEYEEESREGMRKFEKRSVERVLHVFPTTGKIDGRVFVGEKHRGLFKVRTFTLDVDVQGTFVLDGKAKVERTRAGSRIVWGRPAISFALSDPRGLAGTPTLDWAGERLPLERGTAVRGSGFASGLHAQSEPIDPTQPQSFPYRFVMRVSGTQSIAIVPLADDNRVRLASDWPHPRFAGQFLPLPESQEVGNTGFVAQWAISALSSTAQQRTLELADRPTSSTPIETLEVGFIDPIDIYSLSDRALKYGFMFIGLTFGCFIVFEIVKRLPIHPAQYLLVGLALATFFLLLIGLSEHIPFWMAYVIAATACVALLGFYLATVLRSVGRGVAFAAVLTALYGALYGLLVSEDSALLLGSVLVFAMLAAAMVLTRKVDWYRVGASELPAPKANPA